MIALIVVVLQLSLVSASCVIHSAVKVTSGTIHGMALKFMMVLQIMAQTGVRVVRC